MPWLVLLAAALFAAGPFLTSFDGFEASDFPVPQTEPLVQPPGWAFSIWGLIYPWLILSTIVGATWRRDDAAWVPHRPWLSMSLLVGALWLPTSQASPLLATLMIWVMLLTAIAALVRTPRTDRWLLRVPLGLFAGWLTAASSISIGIVGAGFDFAFSTRVWAMIALATAIFVAIVVHLTAGRLPEYGLPIVWGFGALAYGTIDRDLMLALLAAAAALVVISLMVFARKISESVVTVDQDDPYR